MPRELPEGPEPEKKSPQILRHLTCPAAVRSRPHKLEKTKGKLRRGLLRKIIPTAT